MEKAQIRTAIVPGSFDPMTLGHKAVIKAAAELFDRVIVAVMINPEKADKGFFTFEQKKKIAELTCKEFINVEVEISFGMLWEFARDKRAVAIVKGVRNTEDFEYEQKMAEYNKEHYPLADTIYIPAYGDEKHISSTLIRSALKNGNSPREFLDREAADYIEIIMQEN